MVKKYLIFDRFDFCAVFPRFLNNNFFLVVRNLRVLHRIIPQNPSPYFWILHLPWPRCFPFCCHCWFSFIYCHCHWFCYYHQLRLHHHLHFYFCSLYPFLFWCWLLFLFHFFFQTQFSDNGISVDLPPNCWWYHHHWKIQNFRYVLADQYGPWWKNQCYNSKPSTASFSFSTIICA